MRATSFVFYQNEIELLARECGIRDHEMEEFLEFFDQVNNWIHLPVEVFHDHKARQEKGMIE